MGREKQKGLKSQLGTAWDQIPFLVLFLLKTSIISSLCSINFQSALSNLVVGGELRDGLDRKNPKKMIIFFLISIFKTSCHPHNQAELCNPFLWGFSQVFGLCYVSMTFYSFFCSHISGLRAGVVHFQDAHIDWQRAPKYCAAHRAFSAARVPTQSSGVFEISIIYVIMLWVNADWH